MHCIILHPELFLIIGWFEIESGIRDPKSSLMEYRLNEPTVNLLGVCF
jgi:hypothetical protein